MTRAAIFTLTLRTPSAGRYRRLRRAIKTLLRRDELKLIAAYEHTTARASRRPLALAAEATQARRGDKPMDMRKYSGKAFLKVDDLKDGPHRVVIADVTQGKYDKPDLEFDDGTRLGVNATNNRTLIKAYGSESDDWLNKEIELSVGPLMFEGKLQDAILVKPISPPIEKKPPPQKPKSSYGGDLDDDIPY